MRKLSLAVLASVLSACGSTGSLGDAASVTSVEVSVVELPSFDHPPSFVARVQFTDQHTEMSLWGGVGDDFATSVACHGGSSSAESNLDPAARLKATLVLDGSMSSIHCAFTGTANPTGFAARFFPGAHPCYADDSTDTTGAPSNEPYSSCGQPGFPDVGESYGDIKVFMLVVVDRM